MISKNHGTALITALFIMAITAIAATAMSLRIQIDIRRTQLILNSEQLYLYAEGVEFWAIGVLKANLKNKNKNKLVDQLPKKLPVTVYANAVVSGLLVDEQAKFNINNLSSKKFNYVPGFVKMIRAISRPQLSLQKATFIANTIRNKLRVSGPQEKQPEFFSSISELRLTGSISSRLYAQLARYITALPGVTKININTAPAEVLMTLGPGGLTRKEANIIINARENSKGFKSTEQIKENTKLKPLSLTDKNYTLTSSYFLVTSYATLGKQQLTLFSLLHRVLNPQNKKVQVAIVWQSHGIL